jgi:hypothetical protein
MKDFIRVGQKVRVIKEKLGYKIGDIYEVFEYKGKGDCPGWNSILYPNGEFGQIINNPGQEEYFELVTEETDEQLFEMFKAGMEAKNKLIEMGSLEYDFLGHWRVPVPGKISDFRLKPKTFETFYVNNKSWKVSLHNDILNIGCKSFNKNEFHDILVSMVKHNNTHYYKDVQFNATRSGIQYETHILSWSDAELILNKLNELEK